MIRDWKFFSNWLTNEALLKFEDYRFADESPGCPVAVNQSPRSVDKNSVPRVLSKVSMEPHSWLVLGAFGVTA